MEAKILVVDDEEVIRNLVARNLEAYGYTIDLADSVKSAIELMESTRYDIIIADKNMPDLDNAIEGGMNLLRYVKKHMPTTKIIIMTGYATIETAVEAMKLGAFDYLTKPFTISDLKEKIDRITEYKAFVNSENALQIYKTIHNELLNLLENRNNLPDDELNKLLKSLGIRIDHLFGAQKEWEEIIRIQSEALKNIAGYAEKLIEQIPQTDPSYSLVEKICEESNKRV